MDPWNNKSVKDDTAQYSFPDFSDESGAGGAPRPHEKPLLYEETPEITPITSEAAKQTAADPVPDIVKTPELPQAHSASPPEPFLKKKASLTAVLFMTLVFAAQFGLGVFASLALRDYFPDGFTLPFIAAEPEESVPNRPSEEGEEGQTMEPTAKHQEDLGGRDEAESVGDREEYVMAALSKSPVKGVSFRLPTMVQSPICDGNNCASQGTNLPGGSRFTVAARGKGQGLPLTKGAKIVDGSGRDFVLSNVVAAGFNGRKFVGDFSGRTLNGFSFSAIQGVILELSNDLELEMSVFKPSGQKVDWEKDLALFEQIIKTVKFDQAMPSLSSPSPSPAPTTVTGSVFLDDAVRTGP